MNQASSCPPQPTPDGSLALHRLREMGFNIPHRPMDGWLPATCLFPWHSLLVMKHTSRAAHGGAEHLAHLLVRRRHGVVLDVANNARPAHVLCCNIPVGTAEEAAQALMEEALSQPRAKREPILVAVLHGLAQLEHGGGGPKATRGRLARLIANVDPGDEDDAARAALSLVVRHQIADAMAFAADCILSDDSDVMLSGMEALLGMGKPGLDALADAPKHVNGAALKAFKAIDAGLQHDLDPMHGLLTSDDWKARNAAVRVLRSLVVHHGLPPDGPLEILVNRFRDDTDCDNRNAISHALGDIIARVGPGAVAPVLALAEEFPSEASLLLNALVYGGAPGISVGCLHDLSTRMPRVAQRSRSAIRRLLAVATPDYPPRLEDWLDDVVIQAVQWGFQPPDAVRPWFEDAGTIPPWQALDVILHGERMLHDGSMASATLASSPALAPALELLAPRLMNRGEDAPWTVVMSLAASSAWPSGLPTAWMRTALGGLRAGPPLGERPEDLGRLIAVAASALDGPADHALELIGSMSASARALASHALRTLPSGIASIRGDDCNPPASGCGPRGKNLPGHVFAEHPPTAALLDPSLLQFFGLQPAGRMAFNDVIERLLTAGASSGPDYPARLVTWSDGAAHRLIEAVPRLKVQQAIVSTLAASDNVKVASRLARALGPKAAEGDLGPLVVDLGQAKPTGADPSADADADPDLHELEALLRDIP